ncbi:hypothetical protein PSECIP111951_01145 [Pseudoalteromonas holothuriae]|uniref:DUF4376 domain-containing protein n=1 Tax=Pseudoalteromonas holothuriae TaxID=2963714 RepID=A0ABN8ULQ1_9GAMM|nr:hypothetical protein [Pseudoalteromonas sp. CIP111951]CAH9054962.1 hypothetical protein PSECIP111951_01145 [Pseudoalteromonas sp. CIP111951]
MSEQMTEQENEMVTEQQPVTTYQGVHTKIALRHPQAQVTQALQLAIEQEQSAHAQAHAQWLEALPAIDEAIEQAQAHNAENPTERVEVPTRPDEPLIDLAKRRACYEIKKVEVDLELTTEAQAEHVVYDDDVLIAYHHPKTIAHSTEQIAAVKRERFKAQRAANVAAITVEVDDLEFDGDELSQQRMARAILLMSDTDKQLWVLANNQAAEVTKQQLTQACLLAAQQQSQVWVQQ